MSKPHASNAVWFCAAIRAGGEIRNLTFELKEHRGWTGIAVSGANGYPSHRDQADKAVREINALLHAGFPFEGLAIAARLSQSNHAEIIRGAAERLLQRSAAA